MINLTLDGTGMVEQPEELQYPPISNHDELASRLDTDIAQLKTEVEQMTPAEQQQITNFEFPAVTSLLIGFKHFGISLFKLQRYAFSHNTFKINSICYYLRRTCKYVTLNISNHVSLAPKEYKRQPHPLNPGALPSINQNIICPRIITFLIKSNP